MITKADVDNISRLTRLQMSEVEKATIRGQLQQILVYVEKLNELDLQDVEPTCFMEHSEDVMREDRVGESLSREDALRNAPSQGGGFFRVPKVIT